MHAIISITWKHENTEKGAEVTDREQREKHQAIVLLSPLLQTPPLGSISYNKNNMALSMDFNENRTD